MSCASATGAWTRSGAGCRTRRSAIGAARTTRSTGSASCSSPAASGSTRAATPACCWACGPATPRTRCSAPGWPRNPSATSTSPPIAEAAATLLDKAIAGCIADEVPEIRSLGHTLKSWRTEILAHHDTGASNGPTEGLNLCVKKVKRCGHGFKKFEHYRLRVLLHAGGVTWPSRPHPPRIRTRSPHSVAVQL